MIKGSAPVASSDIHSLNQKLKDPAYNVCLLASLVQEYLIIALVVFQVTQREDGNAKMTTMLGSP